MMKIGETSTVDQASTVDQEEEDASAEIDYLLQKQTALRKAIELRDTASQAVEDAKGEMEKSTAAQKLTKYEGVVIIALRRAEDAKAVLVGMGVDVDQFDGVELLSAGPSPTVSPSKSDGRVSRQILFPRHGDGRGLHEPSRGRRIQQARAWQRAGQDFRFGCVDREFGAFRFDRNSQEFW